MKPLSELISERAALAKPKFDPTLKAPDGAHNLAVRLQSCFALEGVNDWRFMGVASRDLLEKTEADKAVLAEVAKIAVSALERIKNGGVVIERSHGSLAANSLASIRALLEPTAPADSGTAG